MNAIVLIVAVLLAVLIIVVIYNMYQENQYRKNIRRQFGHANQDALMETQTTSVRDGQSFGGERYRSSIITDTEARRGSNESVEMEQEVVHVELQPTIKEPIEVKETVINEYQKDIAKEKSSVEVEEISEPMFELTAPEINSKAKRERVASVRKPLMRVEELGRTELKWFDKRIDFMAYVALYEPKELQAIPRFALHYPFQIVGCGMEGRFCLAEPIPNFHYQAFVIGLQGISRKGLVGAEELKYFGTQVKQFAEKMDGNAFVADVTGFIGAAAELDQLCAKVDQTIAMHLVSQTTIPGVALRNTLENCGFVLMLDGTFVYRAKNGDVLYTIVALDGSEFTDALLLGKPYKGFSMLFDITKVPMGERNSNNFNDFMNLVVRLSKELALDVVDDQIKPLSTEWLKEVRDYVGALQQEMLEVGIEPGGPLAKRLFA